MYVFGHRAPLQAIRDRNGNELTITRASSTGPVTQLSGPNGRRLTFTPDPANGARIKEVKDNIGRTVTYDYDGSGRLSQVTDPAGGKTTYTYDTAGRMLTITDPRANALTPAGAPYLTNTYYTSGTNLGRVQTQQQADGTQYGFAYDLDPSGKLRTTLTDARGTTRVLLFDATTRYLVQDTHGANTAQPQTTTFSRRSDNLLDYTVNPLGQRTNFAYDPLGNVTSITRLVGTSAQAATTFRYEGFYSQLQSVTDPLNHTTSFGYDGEGNLVVATDPLGHSTVLSYNGAGQPVQIADPLDRTVQLAYEQGDLVATTDPLGRTTRRFVDQVGRTVVSTNALGQTGRRAYDALGRVTTVTDSTDKQVAFTYDPNSNLLSVSDQRRSTGSPSVTSYTYDAMDRLATRTDPPTTQFPSGNTETYTYAPSTHAQAGELIRFTDRRGKDTTYCYDGLHRRTFAGFGTISVPGACSAGSNYESTIAYTYDVGNRLLTAVDSATGTVSRSYDDVARTTSETTPQGTVSYGYDAAGRRSSMSASGQSSVSYSYDDASRLTQISQGSNTVGFTYDATSRRATLTLPNGITTSYGYDAGGQLTSLGYTQSSTSVGSLTYGYDLAGQRASQTGLVGGVAPTSLPAAMTGTTTYDNANRLQSWNGTTLPTNPWDANGNLVNDGTRTYTWNARNQLASTASGGTTTSFAYDALGRRQSRAVSGTTTSFLYDGLNPAQEQVGGSASANMLTGQGTDEFYARTESSTTRTYLTDALGSTVGLAGSGGVQTEYSYEPFGRATLNGTASSNPYQFTGREQDSAELHYFRARYYQPTFQRFVSEDPVGFGGGDLNLYAYTSNSPTNYTDPLGLEKGGPRATYMVGIGHAAKRFVELEPRSVSLQGDCTPRDASRDRIISSDPSGSWYEVELPDGYTFHVIQNIQPGSGFAAWVIENIARGQTIVFAERQVWSPVRVEFGEALYRHEVGHILQQRRLGSGYWAAYVAGNRQDPNPMEVEADCIGGTSFYGR